MTEQTPLQPSKRSMNIVQWITSRQIKNEKGDPITFRNHEYLVRIYADDSPNLVVMKSAQCGLSTAAILRNHFDAKQYKLDIIYTLPTDGDVNTFVSGKVNRIIANNPDMLRDVVDKDSVEQKKIGNSYEYFRGTFTKKAAIMITADRLVHDEIDSSNQANVRDFQARIQHSKRPETHVLSHPSTPKNGVHLYFINSDQKEWFITCPHCKREQYLSWDTEDPKKMSIDLERNEFVCKKCHGILTKYDRRRGSWRAKKFPIKPKWSGYHVSLLMNPDFTAAQIIEKYNEVVNGKQTMDFFYNKVLGLPYAGGGNTVSEDQIMALHTTDQNKYEGRLIMGVDTGIALRYVVGNIQGLVSFGEMKAYVPDKELGIELEDSLEYFLKKFPDLIMVIDQGGDIVGSRQLRAKYPGRVFLCHYRQDRKTMELTTWGEGDESGNVVADRNRMIQLLANETRDKGFRIYNGTPATWYDYALHWSHIYRVWEENALGINVYKWLRNDRDDWVHATVYYRIGLMRFGTQGFVETDDRELKPNSYLLNADGQSVSFNPDDMFRRPTVELPEDEYDWRTV